MEKFRFGMSCCGAQNLTEEDFRNYAQAGVVELELSFTSDRHHNLNFKQIKERADRHGIHLWSYHFPFGPFDQTNIANSDAKVRWNTILYLKELMYKASAVGIKNMVIHPSGEPYREEERDEALKYATESLSILAPIAADCGAVIAVENLPRTCLGRNSAEIKQLLEADSRLRVCFDTNHLLAQDGKEFILEVGEKIITTHFSDYDFIDERHWLPGEGKINWNEILDTLESIGYDGPILYELIFQPEKTIDRRILTCMDFKENYYLLKNRLPLTPIGKTCI